MQGVVDGYTIGIVAFEEGFHATVGVDTGTGQGTATKDGTAYATAVDDDVGVTLHATGSVVDVLRVAAAAKDAAVVLLSVFAGADVGAPVDGGTGVTQDVAVGPPPKVEP